jgi:hypothetical protein
MALNEDKLNEFLGRFVTDLGATAAAGNVAIGHQLGLYKALATGPATAEGLAERTRTIPRYVAEWLRGQAAGGYVEYDAASDTYSMTEEQAFILTNPDGAVYAPDAFVLALGTLRSVPRITEAFRTGTAQQPVPDNPAKPSYATEETTMHPAQRPPNSEDPDRRPQTGAPAMTSPAPGPADLTQRRHLEKTVSWTGRERLRCLWYRLRLTVAEMNYATHRMVELQAPWISDERPR